MRIRSIGLSWFRGAAESAELDAAGRSIVIYGPNGAGKSSFVDGVEYLLRGGRVRHLAHEYSGRHQEKAILNTHRPDKATATVSIMLSDKSEVACTIAPSGAFQLHAGADSGFLLADPARLVLRQDEVSEFIHATKGEKYSVLLPLLGLEHLEVAAENLHQLARRIRSRSGALEAEAEHRVGQRQFTAAYDVSPPDTASDAIRELCDRYVDEPHSHAAPECRRLVEAAIDQRLSDTSALERQRVDVEALALTDLREGIREVRSARERLADVADRAIQNRLDALRSTQRYLEGRDPITTVECPACGTSFETADLVAYVAHELEQLERARVVQQEFRAQSDSLRRLAERTIQLCKSEHVTRWAAGDATTAETVNRAAALSLPTGPLGEDAIAEIEATLLPAVIAAASAAAFGPSAAEDLATAQRRFLAATQLYEAERALSKAQGALDLVDMVETHEAEVRGHIQEQTSDVIDDISSDIQRMWAILHPAEPIEDVHLHVPANADKAIDLALKFYGKPLPSPRLTLSEGYRNSLGLCVFFAMASRTPEGQRPILLDDVIVSLDRGHRGMVVEILQKEFGDRQILIFTHDRDWYADLRHQLGEGEWLFKSLLPYTSPAEGIRWSHRTGSLDDARGYLDSRPDTAANEARKVMDVETAIVVERLGLPLPFARGLRNDRRTCQEFLQKLVSEGKRRLQVRDDDGAYKTNEEGVAALESARRLLVTWANRGAHSEDVTRDEADKLIVTCEMALAALSCQSCGKAVTFAEAKNGSFQCQCGALRWKA